jgi:catechol 2,3-dioxygenase-like lactoylglutathione lyase family enzyme
MRLSPAVMPLLLIAASAAAQPPSPPADAVPPSATTVGFMHAIHATNRVDTTLAFYTEVFGLEAKIQPFENPAVAILTDSPGVKLRIAMLRLPGRGMNFELTEFTNVPRNPAQPSIVDPGAPHMKVLVRDLKPVTAALDKLDAVVLTRSHKPVRVTTDLGAVDAIFFRDPDGYLVEAVQVPPSAATVDGNVQGAIMGLTVENLEASLGFWGDQLGFDIKPDAAGWSSDAAMLDLYGVKGKIEFRTARGVVPGSNARIELVEFRNTPRKPFSLRVPDPGASGMAIRVAAIDQLLPKLKGEGVRVLSKDRALVEWSDTLRNVFVKDPNGLNIELVGDAPKAN